MYESLIVSGDAIRLAAGDSDEEALLRAAHGDRAAFGQLYDLYVDRVYAYLRVRTPTEDDASDLTQQVFVQALVGLPRYQGQRLAFAPWLFRIARNAAIDAHRRRRSTTAWDLLPEALHPMAGDDVEESVLRQETIARVQGLVRTLSPETREMLALRFGAGLSVADVAAVIGKKEGAVKQQLIRTIRKLRENYRDTTD